MTSQANILFDFSKISDLDKWRIVDDVVMGGVSDGNLKINENGNAVFYGDVSLENNGGFSSIRHEFDTPKNTNSLKKIVIVVKGDGKNYQFRIKDKSNNYYSYTKEFSTTKSWENISLELSDFEPIYRGRKLNFPNFSSTQIEEISILIGNKKNESFQLEIDKIYLQ